MDVNPAISAIESSFGDSHHGLPEEIFLFVSRLMPLISVDLLIQDVGGRTLLTWHDDKFFGSGWHVPGGIVRYKEMTADRIQARAREGLGAQVDFEAVPLLDRYHSPRCAHHHSGYSERNN
jgi:ADP-ribose pyrophosphatase YjhB (NUDIX family)